VQHFALDVPKNPCSDEPDFNYDANTGKGSLAVELVSSAISSGYKCAAPVGRPTPFAPLACYMRACFFLLFLL